MPRILFSIALTVWLLSNHGALAGDWVPIADPDQALVFLDLGSVRREGFRVSAWFLWDHSNPQEMSGPAHQAYLSVKSFAVYDCSTKRRAIVEAYYYGQVHGTGPLVGRALVPLGKGTFENIIPDTVGDLMLKSVCATQGLPKGSYTHA